MERTEYAVEIAGREHIHYVKTKRGPLVHIWNDEQSGMRDGMILETWKSGPFRAEHHYVKSDRRYGNWTFSFLLALRRWRGPYLGITFGTGAQDWDEEED